MKRAVIIFLLIYILILAQSTFLFFFNFKGIVLNLALLFVLAINLLENPQDRAGIIGAAFCGFLLDVFSQRNIFAYFVILPLFAVSIKLILHRYIYLKRSGWQKV